MDEEQQADQVCMRPQATPQTAAYCTHCGLPRQAAYSCRCGHVYEGAGFAVAGKKIMGGSPLVLPCRCLDCGKDATPGRRVNKVLYSYSALILLGLFVGLIMVVILYYVTRKELRLVYSLCPECSGRRRKRNLIAWGMWLLFVASIGVTIAEPSAWLGILIAVCFVAAVVASVMASSSLRAVKYEAGVFTVKGFRREFLATLAGPTTP